MCFILEKDLAPDWQMTRLFWNAFYGSLVLLILIPPPLKTPTYDPGMFETVIFPRSNHANYLTLSFGTGSLFFMTTMKQKLQLPLFYVLSFISTNAIMNVIPVETGRTLIGVLKFILTARISQRLPSSRLIPV
jgi:hypothetical protein